MCAPPPRRSNGSSGRLYSYRIARVALEDVLAAVPQLRGADDVAPLPGGLTNTNYKVTTPAGAYVVRIAGKDTGLLGIDRENELHNSLAAAETGVAPAVVAAVPEHHALVLAFLEGETMSAETLRRGARRGPPAGAGPPSPGAGGRGAASRRSSSRPRE